RTSDFRVEPGHPCVAVLAWAARRAGGMSRREKLSGAACAAVLLWLNAYICRDWLYHPTAWMNSLHGFQAALVRLGGVSLRPSWWPYWDGGMPLEFTSAPLVPAMSAAMAGLRHTSPLLGYQ